MLNLVTKVKAVLVCDIEYTNCYGISIKRSKGTFITLDTEQLIALADNDHFFVAEEEYKLVYAN